MLEPLENPQPQISSFLTPRVLVVASVCFFAILGLLALFFVYFGSRPPSDFPTDHAVTIESGMSAAAIADHLESVGAVRSSDLLYLTILLFHDPASVKAGSYIFSTPMNVFAVAEAITSDQAQMQSATLTFIEGMPISHIAAVAEAELTQFDATRFLELAAPYEGYLFPDTYYVPFSYTEDELLNLLRSTYTERVSPVLESYRSDLTEDEIITLASIVEREANSMQSMRMVAGILMNRLSEDMPLQVDASMEYVLDKPLSELTPDDLLIDSPYNTYLYRGLTPTPIGNPGLDSIRAVLDPIDTDYFYYLTGDDGEFYYAKTYNQHLENIEMYLK